MFLSGTAAVKHIVKPWIRTQHQVNKNETRVGMVLHTQIGKTAWFSTDQRDAIWRAFSYSNPWVGLCWAASYLLCNKLQRVGFSIPFKILTEKVNPVDFSKCVWGGGLTKKGEGHPELMAKRLIFIDISIGLWPAFITLAVADWGLNQHFFPSVK